MNEQYDFSGWATRNDILCSDGRTIRRNAFKHNDGKTVPLVWNHSHNDPSNVLGHALLENRDEGVYAYGFFNDTPQGRHAKELVQHGDIEALSIWANKLKQNGGDVLHGDIKELSLVLAGANIGAYIDTVIKHGEECEEEAYIYTGESIVLSHADDKKEDSKVATEEKKTENQAEEKETTSTESKSEDNETVADIFNTLSEKQKKAVYAIVGTIVEDEEDDDDSEGGNKEMKHNVFDNETNEQRNVLSHADQEEIIKIAKSSSVGNLQDAISIYTENESDNLSHGFSDDDLDYLFPEYKDVKPGAPELITRDYSWVNAVINGVHKSPISRIRTRQIDIRDEDLRGLGYIKGKKKTEMLNVALLKRTTDPQTVYIKDKLNRDDIVDITDFDVVQYQYGIMRGLLNEELAKAIMIGDGRETGADDKIDESHIRPIWTDDELYTIHADVDLAAAKKELQGTNTGANFGENYIFAEAIITAALYAREKYKGSGSLTMYCTPHMLNKMLLARDLNGRRIYSSKADLEAALNVTSIQTVEQFEGKERTDKQMKKHKLLALFVNLSDYQVGSTKGGEITRFNQFDIDFNQEKYLIETRVSGALTRVFSAIALEEPVAGE